MKYKIMADTPIGKVEIVEEDNFIISTSFVEENIVRKDKMDKIEEKELKKYKKQIEKNKYIKLLPSLENDGFFITILTRK